MLRRRSLVKSMGLGSMMAWAPWGASVTGAPVPRRDPQRPLTKIAFGSCNKQEMSQNHFQHIANLQADLWIWLGDCIYGDGLSMSERADTYQQLFDDPSYRLLRESTPIIGTWDDHDYASDNLDYNFSEKDQSQQLFLDFIQVEADHPSRRRQGIYSSRSYGPKGQKTQVLLLDVRFFKNDPAQGGGLLGRDQWAWLERTLKQSDADLLVIATGTKVTSSIVGWGIEGWAEYGKDRQRLYDLLAAKDCPSLILTGDRHYADFSKVRLSSGRPLYEFMSSGMTHSSPIAAPNQFRIGHYVGAKNAGMIRIDWGATGPIITMEIVAPSNRRKVYHRIVADYRPMVS